MMKIDTKADNGIAVFSSLKELPDLDFPVKLEVMLLAVCDTGEISATVDLTPRRMKPSSIMVLLPGHTINHLKASDDFDGFFIIVPEEKIAGLPTLTRMIPCALHYMDNPIISISSEELASQRLIYSILQKKINSRKLPYHKLMVDSLCEMLFYETLGIYTANMDRSDTVPSRREELFMKFMSLVEIHYREERTVIFYARELCVTPKHLSAVIKEVSGRTAGEWIDAQVILQAKLMLKNSGMTIQEISLALNFSNQSFFGKYFKHLTGMSPRQFRANPDN